MAFNGTGSSIAFSSGFLAEILEITPPGPSRPSIKTSHMLTTTADTFIPGDLADWGELVVEIAYFPATKPPINAATGSIVITFTDSAASTWTFNGFMTGFEAGVPMEDRATGTARIKVSGDVTVA